MNQMRNIKIFKVTLNFGAGKDQGKLEKGVKLLKNITGIDPVKTKTTKRLAAWGLRPGLPIGAKITLRNSEALGVLPRLLKAVEFNLKEDCFDNEGNVSFGIKEYIDIDKIEYDPKIGIIGLQVCVTLERPGFRIKRRKIAPTKVPAKHRITKDDAMQFMKEKFKVNIGDQE